MKNKIAVFDIDGTIFRSSLLIEFNKGLMNAGVIPPSEVGEILNEYYAWVERRGSYDAYIGKVISMHSKAIVGKEQSVVNSVASLVFLHHKDRVYRYTRDLLAELKKDYLLLAISGSPIEMVKPFARYFGFDHIWGTVYEVDANGRYTGKIVNLQSADKKEEIVKKFIKENNLSLNDSWGVGDTESDISFLEIVSHPVAFNPTEKLFITAKKNHWAIKVERKNMTYDIPS